MVKTLNDIYRLAVQSLNSESHEVNQNDLNSNQALDMLKLYISKEMEEFVYPFALVSIPLTNEIVNEDVTHTDGEKVRTLYNVPSNIARPLGVFTFDQIPTIYQLLSTEGFAQQNSINYRRLNSTTISVENGAMPDEQLYLVCSTKEPPITELPTNFVLAMVAKLAKNLGMGVFNVRNSNIVRLQELEYVAYIKTAKAVALETTKTLKNAVPTVLDVIYFADKDGIVGDYKDKTNVPIPDRGY